MKLRTQRVEVRYIIDVPPHFLPEHPRLTITAKFDFTSVSLRGDDGFMNEAVDSIRRFLNVVDIQNVHTHLVKETDVDLKVWTDELTLVSATCQVGYIKGDTIVTDHLVCDKGKFDIVIDDTHYIYRLNPPKIETIDASGKVLSSEVVDSSLQEDPKLKIGPGPVEHASKLYREN